MKYVLLVHPKHLEKSHPVRGAWIEIPPMTASPSWAWSHPSRDAWIETPSGSALSASHAHRGCWRLRRRTRCPESHKSPSANVLLQKRPDSPGHRRLNFSMRNQTFPNGPFRCIQLPCCLPDAQALSVLHQNIFGSHADFPFLIVPVNPNNDLCGFLICIFAEHNINQLVP